MLLMVSSQSAIDVITLDFLFSGIAGTVICSVISLLLGGYIGYRIGIKNRLKQTQTAGEHAEQKQIVKVQISSNQEKAVLINNDIKQKQSAGNNATQSQRGEINHDK